jgi:CheY-like chemotaxis protein
MLRQNYIPENRSKRGSAIMKWVHMPPLLLDRTLVAPPVRAAVLALTSDIELRDLLMEIAVEEGYGVRCAATEAEAAAVMSIERPGLIIADLDVPSAGAKFIGKLRLGPYRDIPRLAVTATNDTMLAVSLDAPVFFKPGLEGLMEALRRFFGRA